MTTFVVHRNEEPDDAAADAVRDAIGALNEIASAARGVERVLGRPGDPQFARLLAEAAIRVTEAAVSAEEATRAIRDLESRRMPDEEIAAAAYRQGRADEAGSRRLSAVR